MRLRTAARLALLAVLGVSPAAALAQQPFRTPFPTTAGPPNPAPAGYGQPLTRPGAAPTGASGGLPPGYRSVGSSRTAGEQPASAAPGSGGKVMYFRKSADALAPDSTPDAGAVAMAADAAPAPRPGPATDVARPAIGVPPIPVPPTPVFAQPAEPVPMAQPGGAPKTSTSDKQPPDKIQAPPAWVTEVPPRQNIFVMYDDTALERAVIVSVQEELKRRAKEKDQPPIKPDDGSWRFPTDAPFVPPGTIYQAKTANYPPLKGWYEPAYVVHRRLHFEERNAERAGWDFGFAQPFVSAMYFYKDVLLWPNSLGTSLEIGPWDTSAGKCLPGSPTPYLLYPPGLTTTGMLFEAGFWIPSGFFLHPVGGGNLPGPFPH